MTRQLPGAISRAYPRGHRPGGVGVEEVQDRAEDDRRPASAGSMTARRSGSRQDGLRGRAGPRRRRSPRRRWPAAPAHATARPDRCRRRRPGPRAGPPARPGGPRGDAGSPAPRSMNWPIPWRGGPGDGLGDERPVLPDQIPQRRVDRQQPLGLGPVGGEVVLAAKPVVIDTGHVRHAGIESAAHREHRLGVPQHGGACFRRRHASLSHRTASRSGAKLLLLTEHARQPAHTAFSRPQAGHPASQPT